MFEVSEKALEKMRQAQQGQEGPLSIRVFKTEGGWKGPHLVMAFDEQKENDEVFTMKGITFLIEKELYERSKPIHIDYTESALGPGYTLKSELMKGSIFECDNIRNHC